MRLLLLAPLALTTACASGARWDPIDIAGLPGKEQHPDADALLLLDRKQVKFHLVAGKPVADTTVYRRVLVLTEEGRSYGSLVADYDKTFSTIIEARARCIRPDGTIEELGRDKMVDVMSVSGSVLYEDSRWLVLEQETAPIGSVLEYQYTQRHFDPRLFQFSFLFGTFVPTEESEFVVEAPADWEIEHVVTQYWQPMDLPPEVEEAGGVRRLVWRRRSIPAMEREEYAPDRWHRATRVAARLKSWMHAGGRQESFASIREFSQWVHQLQQGTAEPTPEISRTAEEVLRGAPDDPKEKARLLYEWVQENIRYVAVEVGMGGWRPHSAKEVLETKYGDCKDKATLLKSLLQVAGIESHLATLYSHDGYPRKFVLPTLGNTNHAILVIDLPGERVIVDPTERTVPFGALPMRDQEAELLVIRPEGSEPIVTPSTDAGFNTKRIELALSIDDDGHASGTYRLVTRGDFAFNLKQEMIGKSQRQRKDAVFGWLWLARGSVESLAFDPGRSIDPARMEVTASGKLSVSRLVSSSAGARVLRLNELIATPGDAFRDDERTSPVVFRRRERRELSISISIPESSRWSSLPEPVKVQSPFGWYSLEYRQERESIRVESVYEQGERIVPVERYAELKRFFDRIMAAASRGVVMKAK